MIVSFRSEGELVFFFFFPGFISPDFESDEFQRFCEACYRVRAFKPTLTLSGLHAVLVVAAEEEPVPYDRLAQMVAQSYSTTAIQAALLSDGRGSQRGVKFLRRVAGHDRRAKCLVVSRTGGAIARLLASSVGDPQDPADPGDGFRTSHHLKTRIIPALRLALHAAPDINLTTFCVFLFIAQNNERFGHYGDPSAIITQALKITNLPRNLEKLASDIGRGPGFGLVELNKSTLDRRVILPGLSEAGLTLVANIAAVLLGKPPSPVRHPKPDSLSKASSPDDVKNFTDEDFDLIEIENIDWDLDTSDPGSASVKPDDLQP